MEVNRMSFAENLKKLPGIYHLAAINLLDAPREGLLGRSLEACFDCRLDELLGRPWDDELEVFRHAGEDTRVRWLHQVV